MIEKAKILQAVIDKLKAKTYLEIGVQRGKNFYKLTAPLMIAVDPAFIIGPFRKLVNIGKASMHRFFEMPSDDFFVKEAPTVLNDRKIDVAFIDGLHTFEQALKDFDNCAKYLAPNGVVLFHDCNPLTATAAAYALSSKEVREKYPEARTGLLKKGIIWNGDVWKTIVQMRSNYPGWEVFVLNCDSGLGVARRKNGATPPLSYTKEQIHAMTYEDLNKNREKLLGLKDPAYVRELLNSLTPSI